MYLVCVIYSFKLADLVCILKCERVVNKVVLTTLKHLACLAFLLFVQ